MSWSAVDLCWVVVILIERVCVHVSTALLDLISAAAKEKET